MPDFIFPSPDDHTYIQSEDEEALRAKREQRARLKELVASVSASFAEAAELERQQRLKKPVTTRTVAVRMPIDLFQRLNSAASDAATGRSHMIRQMVADYLNSMEDQGIRFSGCLLSVDKIKPTMH
jgi:hypothetical protein